MRFLVDAQLPPALTGWLQNAGHDSEHVADALALDAEDSAIVAHAIESDAVIVTKDSDFVLLVPSPPPHLLLVICGNCSNRVLFDLFGREFPVALADLQRGGAVVEIG
jgi:predicted nuclease of predicted toxin-antitoxin system